MTTDERLDQLTQTVAAMAADTQELKKLISAGAVRQQDFERAVRQGFAVLTELHRDTQQEMREGFREVSQQILKLTNAVSALRDHVADHDARLDRLEGQ